MHAVRRLLAFSAVLGLVGVSLAATAASAHAQSPLRESVLPDDRLLANLNVERAWWAHADLDARRDEVSAIVIDEENIYVQSKRNAVTAIDQLTGRKLWTRKLGSSVETAYPGSANDTLFVIAADGRLFGFDKFTGFQRWSIKLPSVSSTGLGIDGTHVYVGTLTGRMLAYSLEDLRTLYQEGLADRMAFRLVDWQMQAGTRILTAPVSLGGVTLFSSANNSVYGVDTVTGGLKYRIELEAEVTAPIEVGNGLAFVAGADNTVYCLNPTIGAIRWSESRGVPILDKPFAVGETVYITPKRRGLFALKTLTGRERWRQPRAQHVLGSTGDTLIAGDDSGRLMGLNPETGDIRGRIMLRTFTIRPTNDRTDRVFIAAPNGTVLCLRKRGAEFPEYYRYPDRKPFLPEFAGQETEDDQNADAAAGDAPAGDNPDDGANPFQPAGGGN